MFERFTDEARRIVLLAQEEARRSSSNEIATAHVLKALYVESKELPAVLDHLEAPLDLINILGEILPNEGNSVPISGHIPFTPEVKKVFECSLREALQLGHNYIGSLHIFLGLLRVNEGYACTLFKKYGIDLAAARHAVVTTMHYVPSEFASFKLKEEVEPRKTPRLDAVFNAAKQRNADARYLIDLADAQDEDTSAMLAEIAARILTRS